MAAARENQLPGSIKKGRHDNRVFSKCGTDSQVRKQRMYSPFLPSLFHLQGRQSIRITPVTLELHL